MDYRAVCSIGTCVTAMASLVQQLMCTHSPVTVCCVFVSVSARVVGLTVSSAGRDVVDMVSFLADSEQKRNDVSSNSSAKCGSVPHHDETESICICLYLTRLCITHKTVMNGHS